MPRTRSVWSRLFAGVAAGVVAVIVAPGCSGKLDPLECDKIRGEAFELSRNKAQPCATDPDCRNTEWPGCEAPINQKTYDTLKPLADKFAKGECEEKKQECRKPPPVYCKQGLCVTREAQMVAPPPTAEPQ